MKKKNFASSVSLNIKRKILKETFGAFKNTDLDSDEIWNEVLKKKSRKNNLRKINTTPQS